MFAAPFCKCNIGADNQQKHIVSFKALMSNKAIHAAESTRVQKLCAAVANNVIILHEL